MPIRRRRGSTQSTTTECHVTAWYSQQRPKRIGPLKAGDEVSVHLCPPDLQHDQRPVDAGQIEWQLPPRIAIVRRVPHLAVAQAGIEVARRSRIGKQSVGHIVERLRQATVELVPGSVARPTKDKGVGLAINMRGGRAGV
jgi:hypothetical protein